MGPDWDMEMGSTGGLGGQRAGDRQDGSILQITGLSPSNRQHIWLHVTCKGPRNQTRSQGDRSTPFIFLIAGPLRSATGSRLRSGTGRGTADYKRTRPKCAPSPFVSSSTWMMLPMTEVLWRCWTASRAPLTVAKITLAMPRCFLFLGL